LENGFDISLKVFILAPERKFWRQDLKLSLRDSWIILIILPGLSKELSRNSPHDSRRDRVLIHSPVICRSAPPKRCTDWRQLVYKTRVAQKARGVVKGVVKGASRASFRRRTPLTPQLRRTSARRREEKVFRGVYMIQHVAAVHLRWGQASSLDTENDI